MTSLNESRKVGCVSQASQIRMFPELCECREKNDEFALKRSQECFGPQGSLSRRSRRSLTCSRSRSHIPSIRSPDKATIRCSINLWRRNRNVVRQCRHMPTNHDAEHCTVVKLGQWAIAGAALGRPVHIVFRDFPTTIVSELFRKCAAWVGEEAVIVIHAERDLRTLETRDDDVRLILLSEPRLFERTSWVLEMQRRSNCDQPPASPALFAFQGHRTMADATGPALVLHGFSPHVSQLNEWCEADGILGPCLNLAKGVHVDFDRRLSTLLAGTDATQSVRWCGARERQILRGLWSGAALLRVLSCQDGAMGARLINVGPDDYRAVFSPLRSASVQPADQPFDPITRAMVARANAYLRMQAANHPGRPVADCNGITRRELVDLGNVYGQTVHALLDYIHSLRDDGIRCFQSLGVRKIGMNNDRWRLSDAAALAGWLLPWTEKMVRDRFMRLLRDGFISGNRAAANQPWIYILPESIGWPASPFAALPDPDAIARITDPVQAGPP